MLCRPAGGLIRSCKGKQMYEYPLLKVYDPSGLSEDDWAIIDKLQSAHSFGGNAYLSKVLDELVTTDPDRAAKVLEALSPPETGLVPEDTIEGVAEDDFPELIRKLEILAGN